MPFDLNTAKPAGAAARKPFDLSSAASTAPGAASRAEHAARIPALEAERAALPAPVTGPLDAIKRYAGDVGGGIASAAAKPNSIPFSDVPSTVDAITTMLTGAVAPFPGAARNAITGEGYAKARDKFVYEPRTEGGQNQVDLLGSILKPLGDLLGAGGTAAASGAGVLGANEADQRQLQESIPDVLGLAIGGRAASPRRPSAMRPGLSAAETRTAQAGRTPGKVTEVLPKGGVGNLGMARAEGFKITPDVASIQPERVGMHQTGITRQRLSGPGLKPRFQVENQQIANQGVAKELGLDPKKPLAAQLKTVFDAHNAVANEVAATVKRYMPDAQFINEADALGARLRENPALESNAKVEKLRERLLSVDTMTGQQMLDAIRELRANAKVSLQAIGDFEKHQAGRALREGADLLENALERGAGAEARPGMMADFRKTRMQSAKAHDVEAALVGDNVNLSVLKNIGAENLSGRLKTYARIAEEFPELTKTQSSIHSGDSSLSIAFSPVKLSAQRMFGRGQTERLLSDKFQSIYGDARTDTAVPGPAAAQVRDVQAPPPRGQAGQISLDRRSQPATDFGEQERRASILRERQAVLDRPVGTKAGAQSLADELLSNPEVAAGARRDTVNNRSAALNFDEALPGPRTDEAGMQPGPAIGELADSEMAGSVPDVMAEDVFPAQQPGTGGPEASLGDEMLMPPATAQERASLQFRGRPQEPVNEPTLDEAFPPEDSAAQAAHQQLLDMGLTEDEIATLIADLNRRGE